MHVLKSFLKIVVLCSTFGHAAGACEVQPDTNGHVNIADSVTTIGNVRRDPAPHPPDALMRLV